MLVKPKRIWWRIKVVVGSLLIALLVENYTLSSLPIMWQASVWPGQLFTIVGGICAIWHYRLLRHAAGCIDDPQLLLTGGGLYSRIRHPMYLGLFMLAPGLPGLLAVSRTMGTSFQNRTPSQARNRLSDSWVRMLPAVICSI